MRRTRSIHTESYTGLRCRDNDMLICFAVRISANELCSPHSTEVGGHPCSRSESLHCVLSFRCNPRSLRLPSKSRRRKIFKVGELIEE
jgi:hypothetical protein